MEAWSHLSDERVRCPLNEVFKKKLSFLLLLSVEQLLEETYFLDIEKIKTIGSCYMAASGLSPNKQVGHELFKF